MAFLCSYFGAHLNKEFQKQLIGAILIVFKNVPAVPIPIKNKILVLKTKACVEVEPVSQAMYHVKKIA